MQRYPPDPSSMFPDPRYQNANPMGNFHQISYNQHPQTSHFDQAYLPHKPMIDQQTFVNRGGVYHNNLNTNLMAENITEYTIDIDSADRDITVYPNPFKYNVTFAPVTNGSVVRREENGRIVEEVFNGPPAPYIARQFKNIKYIRLETIALPKYGAIKNNGGTWEMDTSVNLSNYRHILVRFKNLETQYNMSTNTLTDGVGVKVVPDTLASGNFYYAVCGNSSNLVKTFHDSKLGNLDRLNIEFYDDMGNALSYSNLDATQAITDVRNPLNRNLQHGLTLVFGVVENELSTRVKYDN